MNKITFTFVWLFAIGFALYVVNFTKIGPVVFTISEDKEMGVHSFDLIVLIPIIVAAIYTHRFIRNPKPRRSV